MKKIKKHQIFFHIIIIFLSIFITYLLTRQIGLSQSEHLEKNFNKVSDEVNDAKKQTQERFNETHKKLDESIEKLDKKNNKENE
ncbi:hypothetical protein [Candidatus Phytoplasma australiense]|uniref:Uncharacterized protein n=1 Tax=Strawberry lethal yellows phytoplasma (CPA) str. NZSb11 TaxID=980422 RepID=R4S223_PHYAS|nr:hypothetical protein [Candidatus Phytoplasma australiense]AGL90853.1 Hypothetical Protein SLY_0938 [Strawberry lethal yellows phytoplasma (CPA) str. NZSb11]